MTRAITKLAGTVALVAVGLGLGGCGPDYEKLEISNVKSSPLGGSVSYTRIEVPEGMIVKAHVVPWNDDNETMGCHVRSTDTGVMDVLAVVNDRDYAFVGNRAGSTKVEFLAEDRVVLTVEAVVTPQPSSP